MIAGYAKPLSPSHSSHSPPQSTQPTTLPWHTSLSPLSAMADTGCQSSLASMKVIHRLGLRDTDLIPVTMRMHAPNNNGITILGAAIMRFSGTSPSGQTLETRQIVYVTSDSDKLFLSRETCTALGMISEQFPRRTQRLDRRTQRWDRTRPPTPQANSPRPPHHLYLRVHIACLAPADATRNHHPGQHNYPSQQLRLTGRTCNNGFWTITAPVHSIPVSTSHYH